MKLWFSIIQHDPDDDLGRSVTVGCRIVVLFIFAAAIFLDLRVKKAQESLVLLEVKIVFLKMWRGFYFVGEKKWLIQHGRQNIAVNSPALGGRLPHNRSFYCIEELF